MKIAGNVYAGRSDVKVQYIRYISRDKVNFFHVGSGSSSKAYTSACIIKTNNNRET